MIAVAFLVLAVALLTAGYTLAGAAGMLAVTVLAATIMLLTTRLQIPRQSRRMPVRRPPAPENPDFARYRQIDLFLAEGGISARHFDLVTRPLLLRLLTALLAGRRHVDLDTDTKSARAVLGEELWPLIDPGRPASTDSSAAGIDVQILTGIVDRLEGL